MVTFLNTWARVRVRRSSPSLKSKGFHCISSRTEILYDNDCPTILSGKGPKNPHPFSKIRLSA